VVAISSECPNCGAGVVFRPEVVPAAAPVVTTPRAHCDGCVAADCRHRMPYLSTDRLNGARAMVGRCDGCGADLRLTPLGAVPR
jgi:hypothetical protein